MITARPNAATKKPPNAPESLEELRPFSRLVAGAVPRITAAGKTTTRLEAAGPHHQPMAMVRLFSNGRTMMRKSDDTMYTQATTNGTNHRWRRVASSGVPEIWEVPVMIASPNQW